MTDVSTWNAVDASNTATPPDGWPEGMQPAAVNDAARMMMGALRREHDRITAQIGAVSGTISTTTINTTTVNASSTITASGAITGAALNSTGNASVAGTLTSGALNTTGSIVANGDITAHNNMATDHTLYAHDASVAGSISAVGTVTAAQLTSTGNASIAGTLTAPTINTTYLNDSTGASGIVIGGGGIAADIAYFGNNHTFLNKNSSLTYVQFNAAGCFNVNGVWGVFSDPDLKEDVQPYTRGLAAIARLDPVTYRYRAGTPFAQEATSDPMIGLMADAVAPHVPEIVGQTAVVVDGHERSVATLAPGMLVFALINAVKELSERVKQLEAGGTVDV